MTFIVSSQLIKIRRTEFSKPLPTAVREDQRSRQPVTSTGEVNLVDIYRDYASAQTRQDQAFFERIEAEDFRLFTSWGSFSRSEDIEMMKSDPSDTIYKTEDLKIEIKGEGAVVTGRMVSRDSDGAEESWRWIDVCVKRDGRWRIISTTQVD
jgi:hypothetical protein